MNCPDLATQNELPIENCNAAAAAGSATLCTLSLHAAEVGPHEHTNSVNRSYSDLDSSQFVFYAAVLCWLRTALQQPLNLALARQQTCPVASSLTAMQIVRRVYSTEGGARGLTQGMFALTLGCALSEALYLWLFEYSRERLPMESEATRDAFSGYVSDAVCRLVHIPLSIVALRQMTAKKTMFGGTHKTSGMFFTLVAMYRENGLRTVFAGYGTTLLVGCQWTAVWWAMYGYTKAWLYEVADGFLEKEEQAELNPPISSLSAWKHWLRARDDNMVLNSISSFCTSASTAVLFNPYLVIRANLQVTPHARLWRVVRDLYRTRGVQGFYVGLALNIGTCLIDGVLASTSYEYAKLWADKSHHYQSR
ncbi:carrier protein [Trypanosoma conorhini]|uniref:Carrier protein n=1 Tax=Trypanosoma conorhini TaxID=83891 RepID=A0A422QB40_9TRYP|nr:carrier protein [Trypanosoma conorhini]RNF27178.1 carrier protein [Trypanosoma conorhini]